MSDPMDAIVGEIENGKDAFVRAVRMPYDATRGAINTARKVNTTINTVNRIYNKLAPDKSKVDKTKSQGHGKPDRASSVVLAANLWKEQGVAADFMKRHLRGKDKSFQVKFELMMQQLGDCKTDEDRLRMAKDMNRNPNMKNLLDFTVTIGPLAKVMADNLNKTKQKTWYQQRDQGQEQEGHRERTQGGNGIYD